jgi:hypothetical protein
VSHQSYWRKDGKEQTEAPNDMMVVIEQEPMIIEFVVVQKSPIILVYMLPESNISKILASCFKSENIHNVLSTVGIY